MILEMHGMYRIELVFGVEMMFVGVASLVSPPFIGELSPCWCIIMQYLYFHMYMGHISCPQKV